MPIEPCYDRHDGTGNLYDHNGNICSWIADDQKLKFYILMAIIYGTLLLVILFYVMRWLRSRREAAMDHDNYALQPSNSDQSNLMMATSTVPILTTNGELEAGRRNSRAYSEKTLASLAKSFEKDGHGSLERPGIPRQGSGLRNSVVSSTYSDDVVGGDNHGRIGDFGDFNGDNRSESPHLVTNTSSTALSQRGQQGIALGGGEEDEKIVFGDGHEDPYAQYHADPGHGPEGSYGGGPAYPPPGKF